MKNRILSLLLIVVFIAGCDSSGSKDDVQVDLKARTVMTSSSLASGKTGVTMEKSGAADVSLTPSNVSGEAVSLLFAIAGVPDEGIVIFGDSRPDIALATATTFAFDFAAGLAIVSTPTFDTSRPGGQSEHMAVIFAHMDFDIAVDGQPYTVRIALVSNNGMQRGDKLLFTGGSFQWFDLDSGSFTATRPSNPARIADIESFVDPIRPNMVFYPFNAFMTNPPLSMLTVDLIVASGLDVVLNFNVLGMLVLEGITSTAGLVADDVIQLLNVTQVTEGFGNSGLEVNASATIIP